MLLSVISYIILYFSPCRSCIQNHKTDTPSRAQNEVYVRFGEDFEKKKKRSGDTLKVVLEVARQASRQVQQAVVPFLEQLREARKIPGLKVQILHEIFVR